MKFYINIHYWPATPHLREVKFMLDDECVRSYFINKEEINNLANHFEFLGKNLKKLEF